MKEGSEFEDSVDNFFSGFSGSSDDEKSEEDSVNVPREAGA